MGKTLITQARGKGGPRYTAPSFNYRGDVRHNQFTKEIISGVITDIVHCPGHSAPLIMVEFNNGQQCLNIAPEGVRVNDIIESNTLNIEKGNITQLKNIPEGTFIYNIESMPGDGGKFCRASGTFARITAKHEGIISVMLPSKKIREFNPDCRAAIGIVAGGGRTDKPFLKAGTRHHKMAARNKLFPRISGGAQNAVDHPFGNKRSSRKSKARPAPKNAPPGRNVGMLHPRRTGRKKGNV